MQTQTIPQSLSTSNQIHERLTPRASPYYRVFKQVVGLLDSLPLRIKQDANNVSLVNTFNEIKASLEERFKASAKNLDMASINAELYQLEIILVKLLPIEDLIFRLEGYRNEFQGIVEESAYLAYLNSIGYRQSLENSTANPKNDGFVRADAIYLISQLQNHQIRREGAESARSHLLSRLGRYTSLVILILSIPIVVFFADLLYFRSHHTFADDRTTQNENKPGVDPPSIGDNGLRIIAASFFQSSTAQPSPRITQSPTPNETPAESPEQTPAQTPEAEPTEEASGYAQSYPGEGRFSVVVAQFTTLAFVCIAGALGAFVSAASRIQRLGSNHELMRTTLGLETLAVQMKWTPVIGLIFAFILSMIFGGGLVQGGLFPAVIKTASWLTLLYDHTELAKLVVWCFIAGFSERFVPDLLDRLLLQSKGNAPSAKAQRSTIVINEPLPVTKKAVD